MRRNLPTLFHRLHPFRMASKSSTPVEDTIRSKITEALKPMLLEVRNDSALHSHHQAMAGSTSKETHFSVNVISEAFALKMQPARHRMIYSLLKEELDREGGIHALQLRTKTLKKRRNYELEKHHDLGSGLAHLQTSAEASPSSPSSGDDLSDLMNTIRTPYY